MRVDSRLVKGESDVQCQLCFRRKARVRVLDTHPKAIAEGVESPGIDVCDECYAEFYLDRHEHRRLGRREGKRKGPTGREKRRQKIE